MALHAAGTGGVFAVQVVVALELELVDSHDDGPLGAAAPDLVDDDVTDVVALAVLVGKRFVLDPPVVAPGPPRPSPAEVALEVAAGESDGRGLTG